MTGWLWRLWLLVTAKAEPRDRMVLALAVTVRVAGVVLLVYAVPLVWGHLAYPGWGALLAVALAAETALIVAWWLRRHRVDAVPLALDLPVAFQAVLVGPFVDAPQGVIGWTGFYYPYTLLVSFTFGLSCRSVRSTVLIGVAMAAAHVAGSVAVNHTPLLTAVAATPGYLINSLVGLVDVRLVHRTSDEIDAARAAAAVDAAALATERERTRHARALHDHVLQTMETLARGHTVAEPALRERVVEQAAWLRRFVETGHAEHGDDLSTGLTAAVQAAARTGVGVRINDARLRALAGGDGLRAAQREALVESVHQTIATLTGTADGIVVYAAPEGNGVLVTVLASGPAGLPPPDDLAELDARLSRVGGRMTAEPTPYLELWVPVV